MQTEIGYDKCLSFVNCQLKPGKPTKGKRSTRSQYRAVTFSRECGSGAHDIAQQMADQLQSRTPSGQRPWTVFDKELITKVLEDHHLPLRMAEFIPEDRKSELQDAIEELFELRPSSWTLIQHTSETMLRLVELGNVILIGRGANLVTRHRPDVLQVRLVGAEEARAARVAEMRRISRQAALAALRKEDRGRTRYARKYFSANIEDPKLYHLTFNTDLISRERVVDLLCELVAQGPESV